MYEHNRDMDSYMHQFTCVELHFSQILPAITSRFKIMRDFKAEKFGLLKRKRKEKREAGRTLCSYPN